MLRLLGEEVQSGGVRNTAERLHAPAQILVNRCLEPKALANAQPRRNAREAQVTAEPYRLCPRQAGTTARPAKISSPERLAILWAGVRAIVAKLLNRCAVAEPAGLRIYATRVKQPNQLMPGVALIVRHRYPSLVVMARAVPPSRPPPGGGRCPPSCCLSVLRSKQACSTTPTLTTAAGFTYDAGIRTPVSGTRTRPANLAAAGCGGRAITLGAPSARRCGSFGSQSARPHSLFEHGSP